MDYAQHDIIGHNNIQKIFLQKQAIVRLDPNICEYLEKGDNLYKHHYMTFEGSCWWKLNIG